MIRIKTFTATGIPPFGVLFAGDLNAIEDAVAALSDLTQQIDLGLISIGELGLQLSHFGSLEARLSGALRADGLLRGLGGLIPGSFTTVARNAIPAGVGLQPPTTIIFNSTTNRYEWNTGTDATPVWKPLPFDASGTISPDSSASILFRSQAAVGTILISARLMADTVDRVQIGSDGKIQWGGGSGAVDAALYRSAAGVLKTDGTLIVNNALQFSDGSQMTRAFQTTIGPWASGPPSSPSNGDVWIATEVNGVYGRWMFQYDSTMPTYKWEFIGGSVLAVANGPRTVSLTGGASTVVETSPSLRAGRWTVRGGIRFNFNDTSAAHNVFLGVKAGSAGGTNLEPGRTIDLGASTGPQSLSIEDTVITTAGQTIILSAWSTFTGTTPDQVDQDWFSIIPIAIN